MYAVYDKFNKVIVSRHRTLSRAIKAERELQAKIKKMSGGVYLKTEVMRINSGEIAGLTAHECYVYAEAYQGS